MATHANISQMVVQSIQADNLRYEDTSGKQKLTVDIPSGSLNVVTLTNFDIAIPDDPDGKLAYTGKLDVQERREVQSTGAGGRRDEGQRHRGCLQPESRFSVGWRAADQDRRPECHRWRISKGGNPRQNRDRPSQRRRQSQKDGTTEFTIPIDKIEVPLLDWRSKDQRVFTDQPLTLSTISVTGLIHQNQASKEHEIDLFHVSKLHIQTVTGNYLRYTGGDTTFEIKKDDPAQKDPATALRVDGIDAAGLEWRPKKGLTIDNLDVQHMAASFGLEVGSNIKAGGTITADKLNIKLLQGGKLVSKVEDLNADVHGTAYGAEFKASLKNAKTTVTKDGDTVTVDPLTIKSIPITQFSYSTPDYVIDLPSGAGDVTLHDLEATIKVNLTPTPKPGSTPPGTPKTEPPLIQSIEVTKLVVPTTTGTGFTITLPSLGGAKLSVDKGNDLKVGKMELLGPTGSKGPFTIENKSGAWNVLGRLVVTDADIQKLGFDVAGSVKGSTKLHAEGGTLEFTAAGKKIDVNRVTLEELEALAGSGTFRLTRGAGGSSHSLGRARNSRASTSARRVK